MTITETLTSGLTKMGRNAANGVDYVFAGVYAQSPASQPVLEFIANTHNSAHRLTIGSETMPAPDRYGSVLQDSHSVLVVTDGIHITPGELTIHQMPQSTLELRGTSTLANQSKLSVTSDDNQGHVTLDARATINLGLGGNVLDLSSVMLNGEGAITANSESDVTSVGVVIGTQIEVNDSLLNIANPHVFKGSIGPLRNQAAAPSIGSSGEIRVFHAMDVTSAKFDTTSGVLSLMNTAGGHVGDLHFLGDASGLKIISAPILGTDYLAIRDNNSLGNIPIKFT